jgi:hypothetical protein
MAWGSGANATRKLVPNAMKLTIDSIMFCMCCGAAGDIAAQCGGSYGRWVANYCKQSGAKTKMRTHRRQGVRKGPEQLVSDLPFGNHAAVACQGRLRLLLTEER